MANLLCHFLCQIGAKWTGFAPFRVLAESAIQLYNVPDWHACHCALPLPDWHGEGFERTHATPATQGQDWKRVTAASQRLD